MTCLSMVDSFQKKRVLEVACGSGIHSTLISKSFIAQEDSILVSCDFSKEMVTKLKQRYENCDLSNQENVYINIDLETDHTFKEDSMVDLPTGPTGKKKSVYGL